MKNPSVNFKHNYLKIGQAAKALGVSIDTLRRWEKSGKISVIRTPGGTRLYSLQTLNKINPLSVENYQASSISTEELLKRTAQGSNSSVIPEIPHYLVQETPESRFWTSQNDVINTPIQRSFKKSLVTKFLIGSAVLSTITLLLTAWITASYLTTPKETQEFFKNNIASGLLSPFHKLSESAVAVISPQKAKELGFIPPEESPPIPYALNPMPSNILAVTASSQFLEVNADTQINGTLSVRDAINGLTVEATPSSSTFTLNSGGTTLTVSNSTTLDQDVSTTSAPSFTTLNLSATENQLVFQSGGPTGTLTWTPTATRIITLPDITTTLIGKDTADTLTNKSISGSSNTLTNIPNSALTNAKITVTAGTNLTGGGDIVLGGSGTLSLKDSITLGGTLAVSGATTLSSTLAVTGALTQTGAATFASTVALTGTSASSGSALCLDSSNQVVTCSTGSSVSGTGSAGALAFWDSATNLTYNTNLFWNTSSSNLGIGTSSPNSKLDVAGTGNFSSDLTVGGASTFTGLSTFNGGATIASGQNLTLSGFTSGAGLFAGTSGVISQNPANYFWDNTNNRLGIGTSAPSQTFQVNADTSNPFVVTSTGNVGIGFTSPDSLFQVLSGSNAFTVSSTGNVGIGGTATFNSLIQGLSGLTINGSIDSTTLTTTGNVGIGGSLTTTGLTLANGGISTTNINASSLITTAFQLTTGAANNYILTSDSSGNGSWASTISGSSITANSLDFSEFKDSMALDASTDIATAGHNLTTSGTGAVAFNNTGGFTVGGSATFNSTINTNTFTSTALTFTGSGNVNIGASVASTNLNISPGTGGLINFAGGSASNGCTLDSTSGTFTCFGSIGVGSSSGSSGFWGRTGSTLVPTFTGDSVSTSGNISTSGAGAITSGGTLTAQNGLTLTTGALNLTSSSGTAALTLTLQTNAFNIQGNLFNIDTFNNRVGIGTSTPGSTLQVNGNVGIGFGAGSYVAPTNGLAVSGNVGIGTTSPGAKLSFAAATTAAGGIDFGGDTNLYRSAANTLYTNDALTVAGGNLLVTGASAVIGITNAGSATAPAIYFKNDTNTGIAGDTDLVYLTAGGVKLLEANAYHGGGEAHGVRVFGETRNLSDSDTGDFTALRVETATGTFLGNTRVTDLMEYVVFVGPTIAKNAAGTVDKATTLSITAPIDGTNVTMTDSSALRILNTTSGLGTLTNQYGLYVESLTAGGTNYAVYTAGTTQSFFGGNVGIGATTSSNKLDVWGNARITGTLTVDGATTLNGSQFLASDGSASAPSYSFTNLTNAGLWTNGDGLLLTTGGSNTSGITVTGAGNIGIGTTAPASLLDVRGGSIRAGSNTFAKTLGSGDIALDNGTTDTPGILFYNAANTNFGIDVAVSVLRFVYNLNESGGIAMGAFTATGLSVGASTAAVNRLDVGLGGVAFGSYAFTAAPASGGFIVSGSVGIGTSIPLTKLDVAGTGRFSSTLSLANGSATTPALNFTNDADTGLWSVGANIVALTTNGSGALQAGQTINGLAVNSTGNVGIGTTNPTRNLFIQGSSAGGGVTQGIFDSAAPTGSSQGPGFVTGFNGGTANYNVAGDILSRWIFQGQANDFTYNAAEIRSNVTTGGNTVRDNHVADLAFWTKSSGSVLGSEKIRITGDGNVGIGTSSPLSLLSVSGNAHIGSLYQSISAPANGLFVDGNVGIGATTSSNKLDVWGNARITGTLTVDGATTISGSVTPSGQFLAIDGTASAPGYSFSSDTDTGLWRSGTNLVALTTNGSGALQTGQTINGLAVNSTGNVGIGTTNPTRNLFIQGSSAGGGVTQGIFDSATPTGSSEGPGFVTGFNGGTANYNVAGDILSRWIFQGQANDFTYNAAEIRSNVTTGGNIDRTLQIADMTFLTKTIGGITSTERMRITGAGNVGIGFTSPSALTHIVNTGAFDSFKVEDAANDNTVFLVDQNGNVGIGVSGPAANLGYNLDVWGTARVTGALTVDSTLTGSSVFRAANGSATAPSYSFTNLTNAGLWTNGDGLLLTTAGSNTSGITVTGAGNVGIGITDPAQKLEITGNLAFTEESARTISVIDSTTATTAGATLTIQGAKGNTTGTGGALAFTAGNADTNGIGGAISITSGTGVLGGGGGAITVTSGNGGASTQAGGAITIASGVGTGSNSSGAVTMRTGNGTGATAGGNSGNYSATSGTGGSGTSGAGGATGTAVYGSGAGGLSLTGSGGSSGAVTLSSGNGGQVSTSGGNGGNAGTVTILGGNGGGANAVTGGNGAAVNITSGNGGNGSTSSGAAGTISIVAGNAGTGGTINGGSIFLIGGTGTGISGNILLGINSSGTARGNVGIGFTSPSALTHIVNTGAFDSFKVEDAANDNTVFLVDQNGNVGIGVSGPAANLGYNLDVWGTARVTGALTVDSTSTFGGNLTLAGSLLPSIDDTFDLGSNTARWRDLYLGPGTLHIGTSTSDEYSLSYDTTNNRLGFNVNDSGPAEIVFDSSGNVGIGTTGPSSLLNIARGSVNTEGATTTAAITTSGTVTGTSGSVSIYGSQFNLTHAGSLNDTTYGLYNSFTENNTGGGLNSYGMYNTATMTLTGTQGGVYRGFESALATSGTGSNTDTVYGGIFGMNHAGSGTVTNGVGLYVDARKTGAGTVTNLYGIRLADLTNGGTVTSTYGVYIGDVTTGTQTNTAFSLYSSDASALNYFAGNVGIGFTSPNALFTVGATNQFQVSSTGAITGVSLNVGSGAITSGLINSQTISSAADFTGSVNIATNLTFTKAVNHTIQVTDSTGNVIGANLTIQAGAGTLATGVGQSGGTLALAGGGATINGAGGAITVTGGAGGSNNGTGGALTLVSGLGGGSASSGAVTLKSGATTDLTGFNQTGGPSGALTISTSKGADSTNGVSNAGAGGAAGTIAITGGNGGVTVANNGGAVPGGAGAAVNITAGNGGSTVAHTGGAAGTISIVAGNGGVPSGAGTGVVGGNITLTAGNGSLALAGGAVNINGGTGGATNAAGGSLFFLGGAAGGSGSAGNVILGVNSSGTARGNVGIGTTAPTAKLEVWSSDVAYNSQNPQINAMTTNSAAANIGGLIQVGGYYSGTSADTFFGAIKGLYSGSGYAGHMAFYTNDGDAGGEVMRLTSTGNVGIGTTSPTASLQVAGSSGFKVTGGGPIFIKASGNTNGTWMNNDTSSFNSDVMRISSRMASGTGFNLIAAMNGADANGFGGTAFTVRGDGVVTLNLATTSSNGVCHTNAGTGTAEALLDCTGTITDYAESYGTPLNSEPGEIVATSTYDPIVTEKSSVSYQQNVVGVISTNPNDYIGRTIPADKNPQPIGLAGRVPVKVSLENGPIQIGDFLTSSSIPGVAMKATRPGMVIGTALEPYDGSTRVSPDTLLQENYRLTDHPELPVYHSNPTNWPAEVGKISILARVFFADPGSILGNIQNTLFISGSGNVGIGTTNPLAKLDVLGDANISGSLTASTLNTSSIVTSAEFVIKNSLGEGLFSVDASGSARLAGTLTTEAGAFDIAEDYSTQDSSIESGDLVTIANLSDSLIEKSNIPYQNNLLGIISTKAALHLSTKDSQDVKPVALAGRVPVKVSTENGTIQKGDYLTSSSIPGVAMKATRPGQVVGKALESFGFSSDTTNYELRTTNQIGKILAFVNVSYADPGNFLASLSLDSDGNLLAPKIKVDKLLLSSELVVGSSELNNSLLAYEFAPSNNGTSLDVLASLKSLDQALVDVKTKQATDSASLAELRNNIASLSAVIASQAKQSTNEIATPRPGGARNDNIVSLNLTPPDILYATGSATLANLKVTSEATVSGMLASYDLNVSNSLKSLGETTLGKTTIAGDLTVDGTFSIENGNSINVISTLYLQNSPLSSSIDIFAGNVTIDHAGNITTLGKIVASEIKTQRLTITNTPIASDSATLAASIGTATLPANQTKMTVQTTEASGSAKVFITPTTSTDKVLSVTNIKNNESFDVSTLTPPTSDINFNWWIVQTE